MRVESRGLVPEPAQIQPEHAAIVVHQRNRQEHRHRDHGACRLPQLRRSPGTACDTPNITSRPSGASSR